jgi:hypothetical protein
VAHLKTINKYATAPAAPAELPAGALMLVEIDGKVYRVAASALAGAAGGGNLVTVDVPTTAGATAVGGVWLDGTTLKTKMA